MFSPEQIVAVLAAAPETAEVEDIDWNRAVVTAGGGVAATVVTLRNRCGLNQCPCKEQFAGGFSNGKDGNRQA